MSNSVPSVARRRPATRGVVMAAAARCGLLPAAAAAPYRSVRPSCRAADPSTPDVAPRTVLPADAPRHVSCVDWYAVAYRMAAALPAGAPLRAEFDALAARFDVVDLHDGSTVTVRHGGE